MQRSAPAVPAGGRSGRLSSKGGAAAGGSAAEARHVPTYPLFDWLRIAMAAVVVAGHFGLFAAWDYAPNLAVEVFFALSGWLIGSILFDMTAAELPVFYFNRTTRVWIPYLVAVALLYGTSIARGEIGQPGWGEFLFYDATFTHNWFTLLARADGGRMPLQGTGQHFWSIAVEEQFYLVSPLLILRAPGWRHPLTWTATGIALLFVRQEFSAIALGVAAAALARRRPGFHLTMALVAVTAPLLFVTGLYMKVAPLFAIGIVLLCARTGKRNGAGRFLGGVSYPLYLTHWIALVGISSIARRVGGDGWLWAIVGMVVALGIGSAAYLLVDRPVLARRQRWYGPRLGWALAGLAYLLAGIGMATGLARHGGEIVPE
jgi:peptidoglycan/LPS O-acetylase OafA/YrhL